MPNAAHTDTIDRAIVDQAIHWRVTLESGLAVASDEQACHAWRAADPRHERAWLTLGSIGQRLRSVPAPLAHRTLDREAVDERRRALLRSLATVGATATLGYASRDWGGWQQVLADACTAVGERRQLSLADGTRVDLNTDSAIDSRDAPHQRLLRLRRGEIVVTTAHPADAATRPFIVETDGGRIRALGTRFRVRQTESGTQVDVFEGAVELRPRDADVVARLDAGQAARFDRNRIDPPLALRPEAAAWTEGLLIARDQRLGEFVAELDRHRSGILRCEPAAAELRISGVFPLDDIGAVLAALERTLPVIVQQRGAYWLTVRRRDS